jgi:hypothetical protein
MTFTQRLLTAVLPRSWAEDMRAESLRWMIRCECGFERSVWEVGGVRWKAKGNPRYLASCPQCGQKSWHSVYEKSDGQNDGSR